MFLAIVMVCSLVSEGDCVKFTDNRGPYLSEDACIARVHEMIEDITLTLPNKPSEFRYKCDNKTGVEI